LTTLASSIRLQRSIDAIDEANPNLTVVAQPARDRLAQLHGPDLAIAESQRSIGIFPTDCSFETSSARIFHFEQNGDRFFSRIAAGHPAEARLAQHAR
jgi:hypothetical protein